MLDHRALESKMVQNNLLSIVFLLPEAENTL